MMFYKFGARGYWRVTYGIHGGMLTNALESNWK